MNSVQMPSENADAGDGWWREGSRGATRENKTTALRREISFTSSCDEFGGGFGGSGATAEEEIRKTPGGDMVAVKGSTVNILRFPLS